MKRIILILAGILLASVAQAQQIGQPQNVSVQDSGTACTTANTCASFGGISAAISTITLGISGTFSGTLTFEATSDGVNWLGVTATKASTLAPATTATTTGLYSISNIGVISVRARATPTWTSGNARVTATGGSGAIPFGGTSSIASAVWATALPGAFAAGTAGYIVGTNVDATISSRLPTVGDATATLNLKQLNIVNNAGSAIIASSTGSNGSGLNVSGNGTGHGLLATSGAGVTGSGIRGVSLATNGYGMNLVGAGNAAGLSAGGTATGNGIEGIGGTVSGSGFVLTAVSGNGMTATGGTNGHGAAFVGIGTGNGFRATGGATGDGGRYIGGATSGHGLNASGTTSGSGILGTGGSVDGDGIRARGVNNGDGINAGGGAGGAGMSLELCASGTNCNGFQSYGKGTGAGLLATGGNTGSGASFNGGAVSGNGLYALGGPVGDGIQAVGGGTSGRGLLTLASGTGEGFVALGNNARAGARFYAGGDAEGFGVYGATNGAGLIALGVGAGAGLNATGGTTGDGGSFNGGGYGLVGRSTGVGFSGLAGASVSGPGLAAYGGNTSAGAAGDTVGIEVYSATNKDAIHLVPAGTGRGIAGDVIAQAWTTTNVTTNTTTTIKSGAGYLHAININSGATTTGTLTCYDNTAGSGTIIGGGAIVTTVANSPAPFIYDVTFSTGLTCVTAAVAGAANVTVTWK